MADREISTSTGMGRMDTLEIVKKKYGVEGNGVHKLPFYREKIYDLFKELGYKKGAEIGVSRGRNAKNIIAAIPDVLLYGVDCYQAVGQRTLGVQRRTRKIMKEKLSQEIDSGRFVLIRKFSMDALPDIKNESLDFVYIDADHTFDFAMQDIIAWSKKVRNGGIVSGHDYYNSHKEGVGKAVNAYVNAHEIKNLFLTKGSTSEATQGRRYGYAKSWFLVKEC